MAKINNKSFDRDKYGRAIINMNVKCDDGFLSEYSTSKTPVISSEVAEFIENSGESARSDEEFTLRIYSNAIDDTEKPIYQSAIRTYYSEKRLVNEMRLRKNNIIAAVLLVLGILVLSFAIIVDYQTESAVWAEVIDIVAWVLIWESADIVIFRNSDLRANKKRYRSFCNMQIEYYDA